MEANKKKHLTGSLCILTKWMQCLRDSHAAQTLISTLTAVNLYYNLQKSESTLGIKIPMKAYQKFNP